MSLIGRPNKIRILADTSDRFLEAQRSIETFFNGYDMAFDEGTTLQLWVPFITNEDRCLFPDNGRIESILRKRELTRPADGSTLVFASPVGLELLDYRSRVSYRFLFDTPSGFNAGLQFEHAQGWFSMEKPSEHHSSDNYPILYSASRQGVSFISPSFKKGTLPPIVNIRYGKAPRS